MSDPQQSFSQTLRQSQALKQTTAPQGKMARLAAIHSRMRTHVQRHEALWIGRELSKLTREAGPEHRHPTPWGIASHRMSPGGLAQRARINVKARITQRLSRLNKIKQNLKAQKSQTQKHKQSFSRAIKQTMKQTFKQSIGPKL